MSTSDQTKPTIPWWRGPSLSFTTVSDQNAETESLQRSSFGTGRTSIARSSIRRSALGRNCNVPSTHPTAVYRKGGETNDCVLCHDGSVALLAHTDGRVGVIHCADGARGDFTQHTSGKAVRQVAVSADGLVGASAALDGTVRVFQTDTLIQVALLRQTGYPWANGVALSADGSVLIASFTPKDSDRGKIVRFDWAQRTVTVLWLGFHRVFEVSVNHDATKVLFIRQGGVVSLLDATPDATPRVVSTFNYMKGDLDVAMDASAERILIIDKQLRLHSHRNNGQLIENFIDYKPAPLRKIDITADGARSVELCKRCVLVRNLGTGSVILALTHKYRLAQCAIAADGTTIIASDIYGALVMWRPDYLPKTDLAARSLDGVQTSLRDVHSVLNSRSSSSVLPIIPLPTSRRSTDTPQSSRKSTPPLPPKTSRNNTPPTPCSQQNVQRVKPPSPSAKQSTPPTSPMRTVTPPIQSHSPPASNPKLPLPPAIHPKFLSSECQVLSPLSPKKAEPLRLELVSMQGVSVSPNTPSPGVSSNSLQKSDPQLPRPPPVITNVETAVQIDVDDTHAFTAVDTGLSLGSRAHDDVKAVESNTAAVRPSETEIDEEFHFEITPVLSTNVVHEDEVQIIPVESTIILHDTEQHDAKIIPVESSTVVGEYEEGHDAATVQAESNRALPNEKEDPHHVGITNTGSSAIPDTEQEENDMDDAESSAIVESAKLLREQRREAAVDNDDESLQHIGTLQIRNDSQSEIRPLSESKVLSGNMFLQQMNLGQPEEYETDYLTGQKPSNMYDTTPRIEEYEVTGVFPAAPSFPVLEPEMTGTRDIFRSALK